MENLQELNHVSLATSYELDNTFDSDKYIKMRLRVCHDGKNPNSSSFAVDKMENASNSIKNVPILANVIVDDEGNPQFGGHDMAIEKDYKDEYRLIYQETPIGLIPESCNHTIEEFNGKNYVFVDGYIWKGYANYAQDIIERDENIKLSMEILVDNYSYNAKEKCYNITDYRYQGITFLNKDYGTGMEKALATTSIFSENNKDKFIVMMEELKNTLTNYNNKNIKEGGNNMDEKITELLNKYNITVEELKFDITEMSYDEIETKLNESFEEGSEVEGEEPETTDNEESTDDDDNKEEFQEKFVKSFELSHDDIRCALYRLLAPVEEADDEWYYIDQVYDNHFEYLNYGSKIYRQEYVQDGENVALSGDRIELFQERLTKDEKDALDSLRNNYSILEKEVVELRDYQSQIFADQREVSEQELFAMYDEKLGANEKYIELKTNSSNYSIEDLEKEIALVFARQQNFSLNINKKEKNTVKFTVDENNSNTTQEAYGGIVEKFLSKEKEI